MLIHVCRDHAQLAARLQHAHALPEDRPDFSEEAAVILDRAEVRFTLPVSALFQ